MIFFSLKNGNVINTLLRFNPNNTVVDDRHEFVNTPVHDLTFEELEYTPKTLGNRKASGVDEINSKLIKRNKGKLYYLNIDFFIFSTCAGRLQLSMVNIFEGKEDKYQQIEVYKLAEILDTKYTHKIYLIARMDKTTDTFLERKQYWFQKGAAVHRLCVYSSADRWETTRAESANIC